MERHSISPPRPSVQRMLHPRPYNTDPIRPLPPLPWPRKKRPMTPTQQTFEPQPFNSDPLPLRTPQEVAQTSFNSSPIHFPPPFSLPGEDDEVVEVRPPKLTVHFRDAPEIIEIERIGYRPVVRRTLNLGPEYRIIRFKRSSSAYRALMKMGKGMMAWVWWTACFIIILGALSYSKPPSSPDLRARIPADFYFTHRRFRALTPVEVPEYRYMWRAGDAGMKHINEAIELAEKAKRLDWIPPQGKFGWQLQLKGLNWMRNRLFLVLQKVNATETQLIAHSKAWHTTKVDVASKMHPAVFEYLSSQNHQWTKEEGEMEIRKVANMSSKAIDNHARGITQALEQVESSYKIWLVEAGVELWETPLLGAGFEEKRPRILAWLPDCLIKVMPSITSRWLDQQRRGKRLCAMIVGEVSSFQAYAKIVSISVEHLKNSTRAVEALLAPSAQQQLASIDQITQAWDRIAGGMSAAIEQEFRFG